MLWSITAFGQSTTASIAGVVTDAKGATLPGATIQAVNEPSGTTYGAITNDKGRYIIQGMRVGGPYKIIISYVGFTTVKYDNVQLPLGETSVFNAKLKEANSQLGEVVVSAKVGVQNSAGGVATNFNQSQITDAPTVSRNIYDVAKLSPMVQVSKLGGISIAGTNNRYNSFKIDGMVSNDVFGLAGTGTNGGQTGANPISLDAIQQIQVVISPFDVRQGGFTGGGINAITKSGTNQFHGDAYGYYTNQNFYGTWNQVTDSKEKLTQESTQTYGVSVGGPIIKDKLFFFLNAEQRKKTYPSNYYPGYTSGYITDAQAKSILDHYSAVTGFSDSYAKRNLSTDQKSLLARIDWNINKNNKFSLRYQYSNSYKDVYGAGSRTYYFDNSSYKFTDKTNSIVAELNSTISKSLYNEARFGLTTVRDNRDVAYQGPNVYIGDLGSGSVHAYIGTDKYSGANKLNQNIYVLEDNLSWYKGNHTLTFGTHNEFYHIFNLFIPSSNGSWRFNSLNDFLNNNANRFEYQYSDYALTGTYKWGPTVKAGQFSIYAQDKWSISENFDLTYGVRLDMPAFFNNPTTNDVFNHSVYAIKYNVKTGQVPESAILVSPRIGFRWYTDDSHKTLVRGGTGIFTGRAPFVWISNVYSNTGIELKGTTIYSNVPSFDTYANDPVGAMNAAAGSASKPTINTVSKNFKYPQVFRSSLAVDQLFPDGWKVTIEGLFSKTLNNVWWENLALENTGTRVYAVSENDPNSAAVYWTRNAGSYYAIINLQNTNKGYSYNLSATVHKSFNFGLDLMASYTFGHSYSVNDGTSSIAYSNWKYNYSVNPNTPTLSHSSFDVPNRVLAVATYTTPKYANNRLNSVISLVYNGKSGQRYSLTMYERKDFNNDGKYGNSLLYIPTTSELSMMSMSDADRVAFEKWIEGDKYAKNHRGSYAERNSNLAPWENHFDLHFAEDFYYLKGKDNKISLTLDILNIANLFNKNWGTSYAMAYSESILKEASLTTLANGDKVANYTFLGNSVPKSDFFSRWHAQIGLRVTF